MAGLLFWRKENVLRFDGKESREGFCRIGRGKSFHVEGPKTEKAREPTVEIKSGARNLESESTRSRTESTGWCVKLSTLTEIQWNSAPTTYIAESVYLVLNSSWD